MFVTVRKFIHFSYLLRGGAHLAQFPAPKIYQLAVGGVQLPTKRETIAWSVDCARTYEWHVLFPIAFMTYNVNVLHMYHIICGNLKHSANDSYFVLRENFRQF